MIRRRWSFPPALLDVESVLNATTGRTDFANETFEGSGVHIPQPATAVKKRFSESVPQADPCSGPRVVVYPLSGNWGSRNQRATRGLHKWLYGPRASGIKGFPQLFGFRRCGKQLSADSLTCHGLQVACQELVDATQADNLPLVLSSSFDLRANDGPTLAGDDRLIENDTAR